MEWYEYIREYNIRVLENNFDERSQKSRSKHWLWPNIDFL